METNHPKFEAMKAAFNNLDPTSPEILKNNPSFFVERNLNVRSEIIKCIKFDNSPKTAKFLFSGHKGSGKTAELLKLREELKTTFNHGVHPISINTKEFFSPDAMDFNGLLLCLASELWRELRILEVQVPPSLTKRLLTFGQAAISPFAKEAPFVSKQLAEFTTNLAPALAVVSPEAGAAAGATGVAFKYGPDFFSWLWSMIRGEAGAHQSLVVGLNGTTHSLTSLVDDLAGVFRQKRDTEPVVMLEEMDKLSTECAQNIFSNFGEALLKPRLTIIYTFPIEFRHDPALRNLVNSFGNSLKVIPTFKISDRQGKPENECRSQLKQVITLRVEPGLFEEDALELLVEKSGGLPRQLLAMAREALVEAAIYDGGNITKQHVETIVMKRRREDQLKLRGDELALLKRLAGRDISAVEQQNESQNYLLNLMIRGGYLIEYLNDEGWFGVNPLIKDLVERYQPPQ